MPILKKTLKSTATALMITVLSGVCEFAAFFLLVKIPFLPTLLSQSLSTVSGIAGKFLFSKLLKYKDELSLRKIRKQFPRFLSATLFLIGAGNILLSISCLLTDYLMLSKAVVSAVTAVSGAFIYKYFVFK